MDHFCNTFTLNGNTHFVRQRTVPTKQVIDDVQRSVDDDLNVLNSSSSSTIKFPST